MKAYCPIVLLNCLGKVLEKLMVIRLGQMAELYDILLTNQIGQCPKCLAINTVIVLMHNIKVMVKQKLMMLSLFLDIWGAFNNVSTIYLLHTMYALGYPDPIISWGMSFITNCTTALSFDSHTDIQYPITTGIP
jgi:hypothetical protein